MKKKKLLKKTIPELDAMLWRVFAKYIKLRDTDCRGYGSCISCDAWLDMKYGDCGHYIKRQYASTRFHPMNNWMQCQGCNRSKDGNAGEYRKRLIQRYGEERVDLLEQLSRKTYKRDRLSYAEDIKKYKKYVKLMNKIKARGGAIPEEMFKFDNHEF